jgi:hypothetical protein
VSGPLSFARNENIPDVYLTNTTADSASSCNAMVRSSEKRNSNSIFKWIYFLGKLTCCPSFGLESQGGSNPTQFDLRDSSTRGHHRPPDESGGPNSDMSFTEGTSIESGGKLSSDTAPNGRENQCHKFKLSPIFTEMNADKPEIVKFSEFPPLNAAARAMEVNFSKFDPKSNPPAAYSSNARITHPLHGD